MSSEGPNFLLLQRIARGGWTEELAAEFESTFGEDIRRLLVLYLWRFGLIECRFDPRRAESILRGRRYELYENTLSDLWIHLLRGLVGKYVKRALAGLIQRPFLAYLAGTIRNLLIENAQKLRLLPKESVGEALRALCGRKKEATRTEQLARLKFRLWPQVECELLSACPKDRFNEVYEQLYHIVDYFFEEYLPSKCRAIIGERSRRALSSLLGQFGEAEYRKGSDFIGSVTPYSGDAKTVSFEESERWEEFLGLVGEVDK